MGGLYMALKEIGGNIGDWRREINLPRRDQSIVNFIIRTKHVIEIEYYHKIICILTAWPLQRTGAVASAICRCHVPAAPQYDAESLELPSTTLYSVRKCFVIERTMFCDLPTITSKSTIRCSTCGECWPVCSFLIGTVLQGRNFCFPWNSKYTPRCSAFHKGNGKYTNWRETLTHTP